MPVGALLFEASPLSDHPGLPRHRGLGRWLDTTGVLLTRSLASIFASLVAAARYRIRCIDYGRYNHCSGEPPVNVEINVDTVFAPDYVLCVPPGITRLGPAEDICGANYIGGVNCRA
ncbi:MAG: DUF6355 family natural product biosynthesis protein [Egibacteraceae bacterium]